MPTPHLRIFNHDAADDNHLACAAPRVPVSLSDVLPLLLHAAHTRRLWLDDFADETLEISQDLYEVLLAYKPIVDQASRAAA
jgi:hypothetical protein